ncbi:NAD(P)-binding protein [Aspergillus karnatakaensis]|uniref:SDR family oxidoreductase n=1 Tax=Aspergillus karnatakaensis TaxID=1810916 RepID=UPI003CCD942A
MTDTIYLITGANRGIGRALAESFLARPNITVIAAVRDPAIESSKSLQSISKGAESRVITVKIDSAILSDAAAAVETLKNDHSITHIDVVIANAGICENPQPFLAVRFEDIQRHIDVNTFAPIALFKATYPLLKQSEKPIFVGVGSQMGTIGGMEQRPWSNSAYALSKTMLNYVVRKLHFEHEDIVSFVADPGFPRTDMGNASANLIGLEKAPQAVEESVNGVIKAIDGATRESVGGQFRVWDESYFPW